MMLNSVHRNSGKSALLQHLYDTIILNKYEAENRISRLESLLSLAEMLPENVEMQAEVNVINSELNSLRVALNLYQKQLDKFNEVVNNRLNN